MLAELPTYGPATLESCPPLYATPPTPDASTLGGELAAVSKMLGHPLLPWQEYVANVALELDDKGGLRYRDIVLTVPRQSGKSWLLLVLLVHRMLAWSDQPQQTLYCSQSITDALNLWRRTLWPTLVRSGLAKLAGMTMRRSTGDAGIDCESGSGLRLLSASPESGHGVTVGLAVVDEAFAFQDASKEQALLPALRNVPNPQFWVVSTAGDEGSVYLHDKVDAGRERCESGEHGRSAYFEWGALESADWGDPEVWVKALPALGHMQSLDTVMHEYETLSEGEFRRAALNQRPAENVHDTIIPWDKWRECCNPDFGVPQEVPVVLAVDAPPSRSAATIVAAGGDVVEVVRHSEGVTWVVDSVVSICESQPVDAVVIMQGGALELAVESLRNRGVEVVVATWAKLAVACGRLYDDVTAGTLRVKTSERVDDGLLSADMRPRAGAWHFIPRPYGQPIAPLIALTLAHDESCRRRDLPAPPVPNILTADAFKQDEEAAKDFQQRVDEWRQVGR